MVGALLWLTPITASASTAHWVRPLGMSLSFANAAAKHFDSYVNYRHKDAWRGRLRLAVVHVPA